MFVCVCECVLNNTCARTQCKDTMEQITLYGCLSRATTHVFNSESFSSRIFLAVNVWRRLSVQMIDILTFRNFGKCSLFLRHFDRNRAADYNYFIPNTKYQISMALKKENLKSDR